MRLQETTLEIEYLPSVLPPAKTAAYEQDDWISDVDLTREGCVPPACASQPPTRLTSFSGLFGATLAMYVYNVLPSTYVHVLRSSHT